MSDVGARGRDFSIMIPVHNGAGLLEAALASLRRQNIDAAQIEVVDDQSDDHPEVVVDGFRDLGVRLHRNPVRLGMVGNFNECLRRAERPWVHLLHADDFVLPGAYRHFGDLVGRFPDSKAIFGRCVIVDDAGRWTGTTRLLGPGWSGPLAYETTMWGLTPVQFAGVIFNKKAAEAIGGFDDAIPHTTDWDMWWRLARAGPVSYTNECLGAYRDHAASHSSSLRRRAHNIGDGLGQLKKVMAADGRDDAEVALPLLLTSCEQARSYHRDLPAFVDHLKAIAAFPPSVHPRRTAARLALSTLSRPTDLRWRRSDDLGR